MAKTRIIILNRYLLTFFFIPFLVVFAEENPCEKVNIPLQKTAEIKCVLPQSCTEGIWTKSGISGNSKVLTSPRCPQCGDKFAVSNNVSRGTHFTALQFLYPTKPQVAGKYICSCKNSSGSSDTTSVEQCYTISVYLECHMNIQINGMERVLSSNSLNEPTSKILNVTAGDNVQITCSKDARKRENTEHCTPFENNGNVTVDSSHHQCSVVCVRKDINRGTITCKVKVQFKVDGENNSNENASYLGSFFRNIFILNAVVLSILCISLCGLYFIHNKSASRVPVTGKTSSPNDETYCAIDGTVSELGTRSQGLESIDTTHINPLGAIDENRSIDMSPNLVVAYDTIGNTISGLETRSQGLESTYTTQANPLGAIDEKRNIDKNSDTVVEENCYAYPGEQSVGGIQVQHYITMKASSVKVKVSKQDEIDLYFIEE